VQVDGGVGKGDPDSGGNLPSLRTSTSSGDGLLETMSWMRDRVSETVNKLRTSTSTELASTTANLSFNAYAITVGGGYRQATFISFSLI
jgi:hypothetical protein